MKPMSDLLDSPFCNARKEVCWEISTSVSMEIWYRTAAEIQYPVIMGIKRTVGTHLIELDLGKDEPSP